MKHRIGCISAKVAKAVIQVKLHNGPALIKVKHNKKTTSHEHNKTLDR